MRRKTNLHRVDLRREAGLLAGLPVWTITYQLVWGDTRHLLPVVVPARDAPAAQAAAARAMREHFAELAQLVGRGIEAEPPLTISFSRRRLRPT